MKTAQTLPSTFHPGRHLQLSDEKIHDPYQPHEKLAEPAVCESCNAVYKQGRWQWATPDADAAKVRCPACQRIYDQQPGGYVTISGRLAREHRNEIVRLIRHVETREKAEHPLQRVMQMRAEDDKLLLETTDLHLARSIGEALERAYKGELRYHYNEAEHMLRVYWER